jgi:hypothetical protein
MLQHSVFSCHCFHPGQVVNQPLLLRCLLGFALSTALGLAACSERGTGVEVPDLEITTSTTGTDLDPDGYSLRLDDDEDRPMELVDTIDIAGLTEGDHDVSLGGASGNCTVQGENPRTVHIVSGGTVETNFQVVCGPLGATLIVTTTTTGEAPDTDGYEVTVDEGPARPAAANDSVSIGLPAGSHQVALAGIASNCRLQGDNPRTVTVAKGDTAAVPFILNCPTPVVARWRPMTSGTRQSLVDVWGASGSDVFAVGQSDEVFESIILHYDGSAWASQLDRSDIVLSAIWGASGSDVYAVGFDESAENPALILHFDGSQWQDVAGLPTDPDIPIFFESVWGSSATDVFIVGAFNASPEFNGSVLVHCDRAQCAFMRPLDSDFLGLVDVWGSSPADVYAVGNVIVPGEEGGTGTVLHYDGQTWATVLEREGVQFTSVSGSGAGDVVAVGWDGVIFRYDGTQWRSEQSGTTSFIYGAWSRSPSDAFAVGENGLVLHSTGPGTRWKSTSLQADILFGVWGSSAADVFAVGQGGKIFHGTP